ncbi:hypothetical protein SAMN06272759_13415 [Novosphingobium sp. B1]|nr:hypothetical protein SAMN06272759_13415 [Novosphingobium sp. B1]
MRERTFVNQTSGSTSLRRAVPKKLYIIAARSPPGWEPTNSDAKAPELGCLSVIESTNEMADSVIAFTFLVLDPGRSQL